MGSLTSGKEEAGSLGRTAKSSTVDAEARECEWWERHSALDQPSLTGWWWNQTVKR